jgi:hypothetical protein
VCGNILFIFFLWLSKASFPEAAVLAAKSLHISPRVFATHIDWPGWAALLWVILTTEQEGS